MKSLEDTVYRANIKDEVELAAIAIKMTSIDTMAFKDGRLDSTANGNYELLV